MSDIFINMSHNLTTATPHSFLCRILLVIFLTASGFSHALGGCPHSGSCHDDRMDFSFVDREGNQRTFFGVTGSFPDDSTIYLLLFDPDCDDCHELIGKLRADKDLNEKLTRQTAAVIAIYPVDEIPDENDPNLAAYRQACKELPSGWIVGIDNGSIFSKDFYQWEHLPKLFIYDNNHCR